jgi:Phosphoserine phosphatase RsbU, N-terminal domain
MTSDAVDRLGLDYRPAFLSFLAHPDEEHLVAAYDLGRAALAGDVTLLDLVRIHHAVIGDVLQSTDPADVPASVDAAAAFLVEALAPFEIARRGFLEATGIRQDPPARGGRRIV